MFTAGSVNVVEERKARRPIRDRLTHFGIEFLDKTLLGIVPDDLVLIGAPSGAGKTQLSVNIAMANIENGRRVHFFALEASRYEIERRIKFRYVAEYYFADDGRPHLDGGLTYARWNYGLYGDKLDRYEEEAERILSIGLLNLMVFYKSGDFNVDSLIEMVTLTRKETDMYVIDHLHYFDYEEENENSAVRKIAKTVHELAQTYQKPVVLIAHLRKKNFANRELVAGMEEFHGSSDLYKIATKVITIAPGGPAEEGGSITYMRIPKNRNDGSVVPYMARLVYDNRKGRYKDGYKIGWANARAVRRT